MQFCVNGRRIALACRSRTGVTGMRRLFLGAAWACVGLTLVGFVLPWAYLDVREPRAMKALRAAAPMHDALGGLTKGVSRVVVEVRRGTDTVTGELPSASALPTVVSGWQVPQLAHRDDAQVAIALMELLTDTRQQLGLKSYAVYLLPGLAVLSGVLVTVWRRRRPVAFATAGLLAIAALLGCWKLLTTNTQSLFIAVTIGPGLWLSLWAFLGLAASAAGLGLAGRRQA